MQSVHPILVSIYTYAFRSISVIMDLSAIHISYNAEIHKFILKADSEKLKRVWPSPSHARRRYLINCFKKFLNSLHLTESWENWELSEQTIQQLQSLSNPKDFECYNQLLSTQVLRATARFTLLRYRTEYGYNNASGF